MEATARSGVLAPQPLLLERLQAIAHNLRWTWDPEAVELFRRLDPELWEQTDHNPVLLLGFLHPARLEAAQADESFHSAVERVAVGLERYLAAESTWYQRLQVEAAAAAKGDNPAARVSLNGGAPDAQRASRLVGSLSGNGGGPAALLAAYFSAEFGLAECLPIFAGGLGILAGDHLKSASDLGLPLVGIGLFYRHGYFRQRVDAAGRQDARVERLEPGALPLTPARRPDGSAVTVRVPFPGRQVEAQVWQAQVGRTSLYLLDTDVAANDPADRAITAHLYGGDEETRLQQEILLGIGGCRVLETLGLEPNVYHLNEGHCAFAALEQVRRVMQRERLDFAQAREAAAASLVFTTHTPVPAGHDYFPPARIERYFEQYRAELGLSARELLALGRTDSGNAEEAFCMTALALRLAGHSNGVSRLHGEVSREMWRPLWPGMRAAEIPIGHVTNGIHLGSWIAPALQRLYDAHLPGEWREAPAGSQLWRQVERVPDAELWRAHEAQRRELVEFARGRLYAQLERQGRPQPELDAAAEALDPGILTIGFGRRFATYKRATLLLRDPERLAGILNHTERPVQVIFTGKAHPRDEAGKELIRQIVDLSRRPEFRRRLLFLEDYDPAVARRLVQGADVWLNTPRRPNEASGTSGMKAAANGVLNVSVPDGWWAEAWEDAEAEAGASEGDEARRLTIGWAIGDGRQYAAPADQDEVDAEALYHLIEHEIAPLFYRREQGLPHGWIARMKASIARLCPEFNSHRMVAEYTTRFYLGNALGSPGYPAA
ncbi:MAG: alpha-glucan family phosphorylase, partial [Gemmatimonadetes bacterium]|nr:alpha-glucan family phosphorylase [Gemmatimonadota bacterium]